MGTTRTVLVTEGATAVLIVGVLWLPLMPAVALLPLLGVMLNGTSSVLYGTVPELTPSHMTERAFALFYTGTIGAGAIAPVLYGVLGDSQGPAIATAATAATAVLICPLALALARHLSDQDVRLRPHA
jgi:MFS family permease